MKPVYIIKIGGNIIDDDAKLLDFLKAFSQLQGTKLLVHGGGKLATRLAETMGIPQQMVDGRRITDAETLKIVTMVYAGYINKNIVAQLQSLGTNAIGLSGADGNLIKARKRTHSTIDYGFAGDVETVNTALLQTLIEAGMDIVIAPITHNGSALLLNTNADTMAAETAKALATAYSATLVYCFEKPGVLLDANDDSTVIPLIQPDNYATLKEEQKIFAGMLPKLDNAFTALRAGVAEVKIGMASQLSALIAGNAGTTIKL